MGQVARKIQTEAVSSKTVRAMVTLASRAPSIDNCQPWRFHWDGRTLSIKHLSARARHSLNRDEHASLLSLGAVLESLRIAATHFGLVAEWSFPKKLDIHEDEWARVSFTSVSTETDPLGPHLEGRVTDRRRYRKSKIEDFFFSGVTNGIDLTKVGYVYTNGIPSLVGKYLAKMEANLWKVRWLHKDVVRAVRLDDAALEGVPLKAMGSGRVMTRLLKISRSWNIQRLLNVFGMPQLMAWRMRVRLRSSAGLICLSTNEISNEALVEVGRLGLRVWISLNRSDFGVQPITMGVLGIYDLKSGSLNVGDHMLLAKSLEQGRQLLSRHFKLEDNSIPCWVFRTGLAQKTTKAERSSRLPVSSIYIDDLE